jgi:Zn-dependent M28 family amino/carboxypeptidase
MIAPSSVDVSINGTPVAKENMVLASESTTINFSKGLAIKTITYDSSITNKRQHLLTKAFGFIRSDTSSSIIIVAPELASEFSELNNYFGKRFITGRKSTKLFVLGNYTIQSYSVQATQKIETIIMNNVVGVLPGKTKPDEFVVFSGHYDHIGIETPVAGDSISNGADDDASGTTAVIELARYFKKVKNNQRTLIFVAFTAEEIGGFGSKYFSEQLNPDKVVAMFNIEMIGKPSKWGQNFAFITGYERSDFGEILQKNLSGTQFEFRPDPYPTQNLFYRSDNATLARLGVPAHTISTDEIDIDKYYHTVDDEVETLDMKNITVTIRAIALSSQSIVNGTDTPKRIDKATVR